MSRIVIIVEDSLKHGKLEEILVSTEVLLLNAGRNATYENPPKIDDTRIIVAHIIWDPDDNSKKQASLECEEICENRMPKKVEDRNGSKIVIKPSYIQVGLSFEEYTAEEGNKKCCDQVFKEICKEIKGFSPEQVVVLLDAVLCEVSNNYDVACLQKKGSRRTILSQEIYNSALEKHWVCIPYTKYDLDGIVQTKWPELLGADAPTPFERFRISDGRVYLPFRNQLYDGLRIIRRNA